MPFGKLPVLEVNGNVVGQSIAIARYLANKAGLAGNDEWESLMIDIIIGNIDDLRSGKLIGFIRTIILAVISYICNNLFSDGIVRV